jgi:hypothetical protein
MSRNGSARHLFATYPRARPPLTPAHKATYIEHYRANRSGQGLSRLVLGLESWMHRQVASAEPVVTLELGAGNLNHLPYCPDAHPYDVVEPFRELWQESPYRSRVRSFYRDLEDVPPDQTYDQIVSIAVLEHLTDLPSALARSGLLLRRGGEFRAGFPSEGGLLWGLAWRCTTGIAYRLKHGLDYGALMRHEHVNSAVEILTLLGWFFARVEIRRFPLRWTHLSFYTVATAALPVEERCRAWLADRVACA